MPGKFPTEEILAEGENENGATQIHINGVSHAGDGMGRQDWGWGRGNSGPDFRPWGYEPEFDPAPTPVSKRRKR